MRADTRELLKFLSSNAVTFFIPPYQRNYEWTEEQCVVFLEDMRKTAEANRQSGQTNLKTEHFFGTITYFQEQTAFGQPDRVILVDGQQRITTTMLFLAALRDVCTLKETRTQIDKTFLLNPDAKGDGAFTVKLKQVESNWEVYRDIVLGKSVDARQKESAVYQNYAYFKQELIRLVGDDDEGQLGLELVQWGLSAFRVATLELEPFRNEWKNPQEIFESMNSLGKPLSLADLVRNYMLMGLHAGQQTAYYETYWLKLERIVREHVSDFIRDYLQLSLGLSLHKAKDVHAKLLYRVFKNTCGENVCKRREWLLGELVRYSEIYAIILHGGSGNARLDKLLEDIRFLNSTTAYSFFLAVLGEWRRGEFTDEGIVAIFEVFRIYLIRRRICTLTAGENRAFPRLVAQIDRLKDASDKKSEMFLILSKQEYNLRLPGDVALDETVRKMDFYHFKYGKFLLALIEESLTKSRPDLQDKHLQVEHIMPQTLTHQWREQIGPEGVANHSQDVHNIGNLTLIRHNQELGQKTFAEKKACYENHAGLQIATSRIVDQEKWTSEAIHKRADWLIERLTQDVLPIPESSSDEEQALSLGDLVADAQWPQSKQLVWLLRKAGLDRVHRICRAHGIYGAPKYGQLLVDKTSRVPENQHVAVFREDGIDYYIYTNQNGPKKEQLLAAIEPHL